MSRPDDSTSISNATTLQVLLKHGVLTGAGVETLQSARHLRFDLGSVSKISNYSLGRGFSAFIGERGSRIRAERDVRDWLRKSGQAAGHPYSEHGPSRI